MRRLSISLIALLTAFPAFAEDVFTQAPVVAVTVYPQGADLIHRATLDLSAGEHQVFFPYSGIGDLASLPRIRTSAGVTIGALSFHPAMQIDREALFTEPQAAAWAKVEDAKIAVTAKEDEIAIARAEVTALESRITFLDRIEPGLEASAEELLALAEMLQTESKAAQTGLIEAQAKLRPLQKDLDALNLELDAAHADFARLSPPGDVADMVSVDVTVAEAGPVTLELTELDGNAGWSMDYDLDLDREAGSLAVSRKLIVAQYTDESWNDVALTLSTARPGERSSPSEVYSDKARIDERMDDSLVGAMAPREMSEAAPMLEPELVLEQPSPVGLFKLQVEGFSVTYSYPTPITIAPEGGTELALDELSLDATPLILASPRSDETAFTIARFTNTTQEPLLPGWANILRDGHFIGREEIGMIPAGAETELGFGSIEGIRLDTIFERNAEGDTGIISRSNTREQLITFTVENLTGEAQDVRAIFPLTFSEQEDLRVRVTADPAPDETDLDRKRGVSAWDLSLAPGETREVSIKVNLDWPQGQELRWYP